MTRKRVPPYKAFVLDSTGARVPLVGTAIVIELSPGVEVELNLAPHPAFAGRLVLMTPAFADMARLQGEGRRDDFAVTFGASNVLHVMVKRRERSANKRPRRSS